MKVIGIIITIILFCILWCPFFMTILVVNRIQPDFFSIIVAFQTGGISFWSSVKFNEWVNSKLK